METDVRFTLSGLFEKMGADAAVGSFRDRPRPISPTLLNTWNCYPKPCSAVCPVDSNPPKALPGGALKYSENRSRGRLGIGTPVMSQCPDKEQGIGPMTAFKSRSVISGDPLNRLKCKKKSMHCFAEAQLQGLERSPESRERNGHDDTQRNGGNENLAR